MLNLNTSPLSALVAEFNKLTGQNIKRFPDRATAIKRLSAVLPKQKASPAPKGTRSTVASRQIVALTKTNPRREGTHRYEKLQALLSSKTVGEAQSKVPGIDAWTVAREVAAGFISLR